MKKRAKRAAGIALSAAMLMSVLPVSDSFISSSGITAKAASSVFGDINGDGIIDGRDSTLVLTYYAKTSTGYTNSLEQFVTEQGNPAPSPSSGGLFGDINGDNIIDGRDATILLTYYAKISTGYTGTLEQFVSGQSGSNPGSSTSSDAEVVFDFGNYNVNAGNDLIVNVKVDSKGKAITAMDVKFAVDSPLKITEIADESPAFGASVMTNLNVLGANFKSLDSSGEPLVPTSDAVFVMNVNVPASTPSGIYNIGFGSKNEVHKSNNGTKYTVGAVNGKITVNGSSGPLEIVTTTAPQTTTTPAAQTTTPAQPSADVVFDFGNYNVKPGDDLLVNVKVDSYRKAISAMDVKFAIDSPLKITEIAEESPAFGGAAVMTNMSVLGANFKALDSSGDPLVPTSDAVFVMNVNVPASTPSGTYHIGFGNKNEVHKSNDGTKYTVGSVNGRIYVNSGETGSYTGSSSTSDAEVVFDFGEYNFEPGTENVVNVTVDSKGKAISAMDVRFAIDSPLTITEICEESPAFGGAGVMTNMNVLGANFKSLDSSGEPLVPTSDAVFAMLVNVPASTPGGTYHIGFGSKNEVHKSNNGTKYTVGSVNGNIYVKSYLPPIASDPASGQQTPTDNPSQGQTGGQDNRVVVDFGNYTVKPGEDVLVNVKVDSQGKPISAMDVKFAVDSPLRIIEIAEEIPAFNAVAMVNMNVLGANFKSLASNGDPLVPTNDPVFIMNVNVPASTPSGTYKIGFGNKNEVHKSNDGSKYDVTSINGNITVSSGQSQSTDVPSSSDDVVFDFGNYNTRAGSDLIVSVTVDSKGKPISAMDVKFAIDSPLTITEVSEESPAFGASVMSNLNVLGANFKSLDNNGDPLVPSNAPVFVMNVKIPASTQPGTYNIGFGNKCEVHKSNDGTTYKVSTVNGKINVY